MQHNQKKGQIALNQSKVFERAINIMGKPWKVLM